MRFCGILLWVYYGLAKQPDDFSYVCAISHRRKKMGTIYLFYLIVGSHLLAGLKGVEVPLASSNIVVAVLKALGEGLGIGLTGSST